MSLTVNLKFNVRDTELKASVFAPASPPAFGPLINAPASMVDNFGNNLVPDVDAGKDIQFGPVAFVGLATLLVPDTVELSFCSQLYVSTSAVLPSVAEPVNTNGVLMGIVRLVTAATTGVTFAMVDVIGQVFVARFACICAMLA